MKNITKGFIAVIIAELCLSIVEIVSVFAYRGGANSYTVTTVRSLEAMILFGLAVCLLKRLSFKIKKEDILKVVLCSFCLTFNLWAFYRGLEEIGNVGTLLAVAYTSPIFVVILATIFLKESLTIKKVISVALGFVGLLFAIQFLPTANYVGVSILGLIFALIAALGWGLYFLTLKPLLKKYHLFPILFYNFLFCFLVFIFAQNPVTSFHQLTWSNFGYISIAAIVSTFLCYIFLLTGIKHIGASKASVLTYIKPPIAITLAFLLLQQIFTGWQSLGMAMIIGGVILLRTDEKDD